MNVQPARTDARFAGWALLIVGLVGLGVLVRLPSHFWLDETMSYWVAGSGLSEIFARCRLWPQSVLYSAMILALRSTGVHSEWLYRLPSFIAIVLAAWLLFRMSRRLFGSEAAWIIMLIFIMIPSVRFAACDARPYGMALLMVIAATDLFVRFMTRPSYRTALLYGLASAGILYFQILFGAVLVAHGLYFVYRLWRGERIGWGYPIAAAAVLLATSAPVFVQYARMTADPASHSFSSRPILDELIASYMPNVSLYLLETLAAIALLAVGLKWEFAPAFGWQVLAVLWAVLPPLMMFAVSRVSPARIFIARYILSYAPGLAICLGLVLVSFRPLLARTAILAVLTLAAIRFIGLPSEYRHTENYGDWGSAAAYVNGYIARDPVPVIVRSQFPESDYFPLTPVKDNGVFAQLTFYPIHADVFPLPVTFTDAQASVIHDFLRRLPPDTHRLLMVAMPGPTPTDPFIYYIRGQFGPSCTVKELAEFDGLQILEYTIP